MEFKAIVNQWTQQGFQTCYTAIIKNIYHIHVTKVNNDLGKQTMLPKRDGYKEISYGPSDDSNMYLVYSPFQKTSSEL